MDTYLKKTLFALAIDCMESGNSLHQLIELVSQALDERDLDEAQRELAFTYALEAAEMNRPDRDSAAVETFDDTGTILRQAATEALISSWYPVVKSEWPSPVAHELARLIDAMTADRANVSTADTALSQYRDCFEILIKFTTIVLMQALVDAGEDGRARSKKSLYSQASLGVWVGLLRETAKKVSVADRLDETLRRLAAATQKHLISSADKFAEIRNNMIGHGARALDPKETAKLVRTCVLGGTIRSARGNETSVPGLFPTLAKMVDAGAYAAMALVVEIGDVSLPMDGVEKAENWIGGAHNDTHDFVGEGHSVFLRIGKEFRLTLSPLVAARACRQCDRQDIMIYDALQSSTKGGVFDLMDYARGHKSRFGAAEVEDLAVYFSNMPRLDSVSLGEGQRRSDQRVVEALDRARLDRNYVSPTFIRDAVADFLQTRTRGVFWLQAPAHVGKTTFVQGLASRATLDEDPILPRFESDTGGYILAYYIRREIRVGLADFVNTIERRLFTQFTSDTTRDNAPRLPSVWPKNADPESFVDWLASWRKFAVRFGRLDDDAPFVLAIDGLDEAEDPEQAKQRNGSLIQLLPCEDLLRDGLYLILTSRLPDGSDDVPTFLNETIAPLYPVAV